MLNFNYSDMTDTESIDDRHGTHRHPETKVFAPTMLNGISLTLFCPVTCLSNKAWCFV